MRALNRLSASFVANANTPGKYLDGGGLMLAVRENGSRAWLFRYQRNGIARGMGLGSLRSTSLAEARERADAQRRKLAAGVDPINDRIGARQQEAAAAAQLRTVRGQVCIRAFPALSLEYLGGQPAARPAGQATYFGVLFDSFKKWAEAMGEYVVSSKRLSQKLEDHGFEPVRRDQRGFRGLTIYRPTEGEIRPKLIWQPPL